MQALSFMKEVMGTLSRREDKIAPVNDTPVMEAVEANEPAVLPLAEPQEVAARTASVLASDARIEGNVVAQGSLQIHGTVVGNVQVPGGHVRIMRSGRIEGDIMAQSIVIDGEVEGVCSAAALEILEHGRLQGTARSQRFSIRKGGQFSGKSEQVEDIEQLFASKEQGRGRQAYRKVAADTQGQ
ncbi:hypothetical protein THUN1379_30870 [Paludibacterium sp. THUN1379]|nr:hypothetical protein THUN1379_30870 [Paludibacterium sp. THUN1379]